MDVASEITFSMYLLYGYTTRKMFNVEFFPTRIFPYSVRIRENLVMEHFSRSSTFFPAGIYMFKVKNRILEQGKTYVQS